MSETIINTGRLSKLKAISAGVLLAWGLPAHALTLGKFQVQSAMGEPLRAEVEVTQFTPDELRGLQAQLASPTSFRQAGMEYNPALNGIVTRIENHTDGRTFIILRGRTPVQDSFIDMILEAQWATGRTVKNYALLLNSASPSSVSRQSTLPTRAHVQADPLTQTYTPVLAAAAVANDVAPTPRNGDTQASQAPIIRFDPASTSPSASSTAPIAQAAPLGIQPALSEKILAGESETITINRGDTLSNVIVGRLPADISSEQMLLALARANPSAFIEGNINLVRAGSVLRMPTTSEASQISPAEAHQAVIDQNRDFAAYALRVAGSALLVGTGKSREMSGAVTTETQNATPSNTKQDKLTLSKAQAGDNTAEAKLAAEREAKDAAYQLAALNKNMQDLEALANDRKEQSATTAPSFFPAATPKDLSLLEQFSQNQSNWAWAIGALLGLLALVAWSRRKDSQSNAVFAPSYDDFPSHAIPPKSSMHIPTQMAEIDLDLGDSPKSWNSVQMGSHETSTPDTLTSNGDLKVETQPIRGQIA
ncbi:type IV pilus assembly protein FimV [Limnohabitans sp.]